MKTISVLLFVLMLLAEIAYLLFLFDPSAPVDSLNKLFIAAEFICVYGLAMEERSKTDRAPGYERYLRPRRIALGCAILFLMGVAAIKPDFAIGWGMAYTALAFAKSACLKAVRAT